MSDADTFETQVPRAAAGDPDALEAVLRAVEDRVYALALRMLGVRADAEDATQEILLRIARSISTFRGDARFTTWVYRVAANFLLTTRKRGAELRETNLDNMARVIDAGIATDPSPAADPVVVDEGRLICVQAMLSCLDRDHRLAFILGEILDVTSDEGAAILEVTSDAYRQRLSRARRDIDAFLAGRCGVIDPCHSCSCDRQATAGIATRRLDPMQLRFATHPARVQLTQITNLVGAARLFRTQPEWRAPRDFAAQMRKVLATLP